MNYDFLRAALVGFAAGYVEGKIASGEYVSHTAEPIRPFLKFLEDFAPDLVDSITYDMCERWLQGKK